MKDYTFQNKEIELVQHLLETPPKKIWWDFVSFVFDYGDHYLQLSCVSKVADTPNKSDEAIIAVLTKEDRKFEPLEAYALICQDKKIDKMYLVRTFLYFTNYKEYSEVIRFTRKTIQKIKTVLTKRKDPVGDLIVDTTGGYENIICHPESAQAKKVNLDHANLVDVGLLLEIEGKYLKSFLQNNGFGFHLSNNKFFVESDDLEEHKQQYDFIKIEK